MLVGAEAAESRCGVGDRRKRVGPRAEGRRGQRPGGPGPASEEWGGLAVFCVAASALTVLTNNK